MEYIKISTQDFNAIRIAAEESKNTSIIELLEKIELETLRKKIMRANYAEYKKTGEKEYLENYLKIKADVL